MKLAGDFLFEAPIEEVWQALLDPVVLAAVMPGCEKLERLDGPDPQSPQYQGELNIKVGPIQGKFSGKVDLKDLDAPRHYTMIVDGRGAPGFVKANAAVTLEPEGALTRLRYDADAQVGGKIASVGQRLIEASARAIAKQSLEGLNENIKIRVAAKTADAPQAVTVEVPSAPPAADGVTAETQAATPETQAAIVETRAAIAKVHRAPSPVVLKQIDQTALAASIAKEVTKTLLPRPVLVALTLGVVLILGWFFVRR